MGNKIEVDPAALLNAANGLDQYAKPDLEQVAKRMSTAYLVDPPGWGVLLSVFEAQFNAVGDYHAKNLQAAGEATAAIAAGLRTTVDNYNRTEAANVSMMLGTPSADGQSWGGGWLDTGVARTFYTVPDSWRSGVGEGIAVTTQIGFVALAFATADLVPSYLPAPISAAALVFNGYSMFSVAGALNDLASDVSGAIDKFSGYANGATAGWKDASVSAYRNVVAELIHELQQVKDNLVAMSTLIKVVAGLLIAYWLAFLIFTAAFFINVTEMVMLSIGPQAPAVIAALQAMGGLAAAEWMTGAVSVFSLVASALGVLSASLAGLVVIRRQDRQGDTTPDIRQIKIEWHS